MNGKQVSVPAAPIVPNDKADANVKQAFITILEAAPFTIEPVTVALAMDQLTSTNLAFRVQRREGFAGEIKISIEGFSLGREPITNSFEITALPLKGFDSAASVKLRAKANAEIGTRHIFGRAEAQVNGETIVQYSQPIPVTVSARGG